MNKIDEILNLKINVFNISTDKVFANIMLYHLYALAFYETNYEIDNQELKESVDELISLHDKEYKFEIYYENNDIYKKISNNLNSELENASEYKLEILGNKLDLLFKEFINLLVRTTKPLDSLSYIPNHVFTFLYKSNSEKILSVFEVDILLNILENYCYKKLSEFDLHLVEEFLVEQDCFDEDTDAELLNDVMYETVSKKIIEESFKKPIALKKLFKSLKIPTRTLDSIVFFNGYIYITSTK